jgi:NAD(P)-dependent dehydrogenase (short-subunit alcohol dehydrogenase family)
MHYENQVAIVTGAAQGLGFGIAARFAREGARVLVADLDPHTAAAAGEQLGGLGLGADMSRPEEVARVIDTAERELGPIDVYFSNAALSKAADLLDTSDEDWTMGWDLNVQSHIWAVRRLLPGMLARGHGALAQTVSAVALTLNHYDPMYAVTKRAALALNEYLAVRYGDRGIQVMAYCPRGMLTKRLLDSVAAGSTAGQNAMATAVTPEQAGDIAVEGLIDGRFLVLTESDEIVSARAKLADYDGWIAARRAQLAAEQSA